MSEKTGPYRVVDLTPARRVWLNTLDLSGPKHCMYGLLEVDVTVARQFIAEHKARTGETLSFTGFLVFCLARAVDEDKAVQAYLKGRKQLVLFDDVDVGLMVERKVGEKRALTGHVIRGANHKTYREIHQEIRSVQSTPVPPGRGMPPWFRSAMLLPWPLSGLFKALLRLATRHDPTIPVALAGTVGVTAVGMFGEGHSGWGLYSAEHSLNLVVGSIAWKPAVVDGRIEPREILNLTELFDHDVIDGAPAARFTRRLVELIESGYGLAEDQALAATGTAAPGCPTQLRYAARSRVARWRSALPPTAASTAHVSSLTPASVTNGLSTAATAARGSSPCSSDGLTVAAPRNRQRRGQAEGEEMLEQSVMQLFDGTKWRTE